MMDNNMSMDNGVDEEMVYVNAISSNISRKHTRDGDSTMDHSKQVDDNDDQAFVNTSSFSSNANEDDEEDESNKDIDATTYNNNDFNSSNSKDDDQDGERKAKKSKVTILSDASANEHVDMNTSMAINSSGSITNTNNNNSNNNKEGKEPYKNATAAEMETNNKIMVKSTNKSDDNSSKFICKRSTCKELVYTSGQTKYPCTSMHCPCKGTGYYYICPACSSRNHPCHFPNCDIYFHLTPIQPRLTNLKYEDVPKFVFQRYMDHVIKFHPTKRMGSPHVEVEKEKKKKENIITIKRETRPQQIPKEPTQPAASSAYLPVITNTPKNSQLETLISDVTDDDQLDNIKITEPTADTKLSVFLPNFLIPIIAKDTDKAKMLEVEAVMKKLKDKIAKEVAAKTHNDYGEIRLTAFEKRERLALKLLEKEYDVFDYKKAFEFLRVISFGWSPISTISKKLANRLKARYEAILIQLTIPPHLKRVATENVKSDKYESLAKSENAEHYQELITKFDVAKLDTSDICKQTLFPILESLNPLETSKQAKYEKCVEFFAWCLEPYRAKGYAPATTIPLEYLQKMKDAYLLVIFGADFTKRLNEVSYMLRKLKVKNFSYEFSESSAIDVSPSPKELWKIKKMLQESDNENENDENVEKSQGNSNNNSNIDNKTEREKDVVEEEREIKSTALADAQQKDTVTVPKSDNADDDNEDDMLSSKKVNFSVLDVEGDVQLYRNQCDTVRALVQIRFEPELTY